jgi:hypothetical protein
MAKIFWGWVGKSPWGSFGVFLLVLIVSVVIAALVRRTNPQGAQITTWSYVLAIAVSLLIVFLVGIALHVSDGKLTDLIIGADLRTSTSKIQYLLWTVGVSFALCVIAMRTFLDSTGAFVCPARVQRDCVPNDGTWEQYLILLGVPAAAAVIAKASVTYKSQNGMLQKAGATGKATVADIATNDNGQASLTDVQYLVFNVIAFIYFTFNFLDKGTFVPVPSILLGLTSTAAATYTLNKALQTNRPVIKSIQPGQITTGTRVTIQGINLFPDNQHQQATVKIGGQSIPLEAEPGSLVDTATFTAPAGMATDMPKVTVVTSDGTETDQYTVTLVTPELLGWVGTVPGPGDHAVLRVVALPAEGKIEVATECGVVDATVNTDSGTLEFTVPPTATAGADLAMKVCVNGVCVATGSIKLN